MTEDNNDSSSRFRRWWRRLPKTTADQQLIEHHQKAEFDRQLVLGLQKKDQRLPGFDQLRHIFRVLTGWEKKIFIGAAIALVVGLVGLIFNIYNNFSQTVPTTGGQYSEGLIGTVRFLNPLFASTNDVDADISSLIFSGLVKNTPQSGIVGDLASSYEVSPDQKQYTFTLRDNIFWHDGMPVSVEDVLFTFDLIKDSDIGSPLKVSFDGVTAEKIDDKTVRFTLKETFPAFLNALTVGILPKHVWQNTPSDAVRLSPLNLKPIGTGPYKFSSLKKDKTGAVHSVTLSSFSDYYVGQPYIDEVTFQIYADFSLAEQALTNRHVLALSYLPKDSRDKLFGDDDSYQDYRLRSLQFPQYVAVFFNQNAAGLLKEKTVRQALAQAIDRQRIVRSVLRGQGTVINGPILPGYVGYDASLTGYEFSTDQANSLLDSAKWAKLDSAEYIAKARAAEQAAQGESFVDRSDEERLQELGQQKFFRQKGNEELTITLTVVDEPESLGIAEIIKENWQAIGVRTVIEAVSVNDVRRTVIKNRDYQAFLYGEVVGSDPDPFPFWHSSQNSDPGLNLAIFTDRRVDAAIEKARQTTDQGVRETEYKNLQNVLLSEVPAIFLFNPTYPYVIDEDVKGLQVDRIFTPADRLSDMASRYFKTKRIWSR